jgi:hypothetical protein
MTLILLGAIGIPEASAVADEDYYLLQIRVGKLPRLRRGRKFFSADGAMRGKSGNG